MGRKLTSWERSQRDRERERKRVARAKEVAARRKKARAEKEKKIKGNIAAAEKEVAKYEKFYDSLVTFHLHPFAKSTFNNKFSKVLEFSTNIKKPKKPVINDVIKGVNYNAITNYRNVKWYKLLIPSQKEYDKEKMKIYELIKTSEEAFHLSKKKKKEYILTFKDGSAYNPKSDEWPDEKFQMYVDDNHTYIV